MIYSLWRQDLQRYDYYRSGAPNGKANAPSPKHLSHVHDIGVPVGRAGWPLPMGAKKIGSGPLPRGLVASRKSSSLSGLGVVDFSSPGTVAVLLGIAAFVYWKGR